MFEPILLLGGSPEIWGEICVAGLVALILFLVKVAAAFFFGGIVVSNLDTISELLISSSSGGSKNDLHDTLGPEDKFSRKDPITNRWVHEDSIEWIDIACKDNKKIYDSNGDIIVIGHPSSKIHTMATYDINGTLIEDSSVEVKKVARKVIFMDPEDKKDEKGKLKKLYEEGYISKSRYNVLIRDLNK